MAGSITFVYDSNNRISGGLVTVLNSKGQQVSCAFNRERLLQYKLPLHGGQNQQQILWPRRDLLRLQLQRQRLHRERREPEPVGVVGNACVKQREYMRLRATTQMLGHAHSISAPWET